MADAKLKRPPVDWEAVEREYRIGSRTLRDIGAEYGVSNPAIIKRAKRDGWDRNLAAKIHAKAESLVSKQTVSRSVSKEAAISEKEQIQASAAMIADKVINQRNDVQRARSIVQKLWGLVDAELNHPEAFANIGEMMRSPDEFGEDKLNDMYRAAIGLPQQVKNVKLLADALKVLIDLERRVLRIDEPSEGDAKAVTVVLSAMDAGL